MTPLRLRHRGLLSSLSAGDMSALVNRVTDDDDLVRDLTAAIIDAVRREGDDALRSLAREYDGVSLHSLEVEPGHWAAALERVPSAVRHALEHAVRNLESVHRAQLPVPIDVEVEPGVAVSRRPSPVDRVGVYVPGGRVAYASSVLMGVVPARVAGVREIVVCSPPDASTGRPASLIMAACQLAGASRLFALGGAGAVAALAYGTRSVPKVDRLVGPGNTYVSAAKIQVAHHVAIDCPAGPSELLVIADAGASPAAVAREMVAQAEHDERAVVIALMVGVGAAERVEESLAAQAPAAGRSTIVLRALAANGAVLVVDDVAQAIRFANAYAPEHVWLATGDAQHHVPDLRTAGTVCVGEASSVVFGDYVTGANHTLPTGGAARGYSGLSVHEFLRWTSVQVITPAGAASLAGPAAALAHAEGLDAHARAALAWARVQP